MICDLLKTQKLVQSAQGLWMIRHLAGRSAENLPALLERLKQETGMWQAR